MNARSIIQTISRDLKYAQHKGWIHAETGVIARPDTPGKLTSFLYRHYYLGVPDLRSVEETQTGGLTSIANVEDPDFAADLANAVSVRRYASRNWEVVQQGNGSVIIERDGIVLSARKGQWSSDTDNDGAVIVQMPTARRYASPGFFTVFSALGPSQKGVKLDRLYVNVSQRSAPQLLGTMISWASRQNMAATIKVANAAGGFSRRDTLVAYMPREAFRPQRQALIKAILGNEPQLRAGTPAFTEYLRDGISWAEDPISDGCGPTGFGMHRCGLIARGLENARRSSPDQAELSILTAWQAAGLDIDAPHLSPAT